MLADGGHVTRNPGLLVELLLDLLPLSQCFNARDRKLPEQLGEALERMLPMLRYLRLGNGMIARFNGVSCAPAAGLATVLAYDDGIAATARARRALPATRGSSAAIPSSLPTSGVRRRWRFQRAHKQAACRSR